MSDERFSQLFEGMIRGTLSPQEKTEISTYFAAAEHADQARQLLDDWYDHAPVNDLQSPADADRIFYAIIAKDAQEPEVPHRQVNSPKIRRILAWSAAACVAALVAGIYFLQPNTEPQTPRTASVSLQSVQPGKTGAVLTLADGTEVVLDSLGNAILPAQPGAGVSVNNGQLIYNSTGDGGESPTFNTMTTPKGRQFAIRLPDGTKVWLNAASSLRYPTAFLSGERRVVVNGEAYFEVAKNAHQPFVIDVKDRGIVEVLGTDFNIHAYENEPAFTTTLVNGSVRIRKPVDDKGVVLRPGQEAIATSGKEIAVRAADVDRAVIWKDGFFSFDQTPLREVLLQLERWYDIEVVYEGDVPEMKFSGEMSRTMDFAAVLRTLEKSNVHFRYENNRKLVIIP